MCELVQRSPKLTQPGSQQTCPDAHPEALTKRPPLAVQLLEVVQVSPTLLQVTAGVMACNSLGTAICDESRAAGAALTGTDGSSP